MDREEFAKRFAEDKEFAEKILSLNTIEEAKAFGASEGLEHSDEEIAAFLAEIKKLKEGQISDEDLDAAVGGFRSDAIFLADSSAESFRDGQALLLEDTESESFRAGQGLR